jgi:hypothetical protein
MSSTADRVKALSSLGLYLQDLDTLEINDMCEAAFNANRWFSIENNKLALEGIREAFLDHELLSYWISKYEINEEKEPKKVGLVLAGNIPAVGWNDIMCTYLSGNISLIKYSDKDNVILPFLIEKLCFINPSFSYQFEVVEKLGQFDAVIATGSNNSARYFESYFGKYPNIIRKNRNAVAVLTGEETDAQLYLLGKDIFTYFGLGCRNVSKLYVPVDYNFIPLLEALHKYNEIIHHNKYKNNFDYTIALFLLNKVKYSNNGSVILREDERLTSRISSVHYQYYNNEEELAKLLSEKKEEIQCIVSQMPLQGFDVFDFGKAQNPSLDDYADGVDTMQFLTTLK